MQDEYVSYLVAIMRSGRVVVFLCIALFAQQPTTSPLAFEAASIKLSQDAPGSPSGIGESAGGIIARHVTLKRCIRGAYNVVEPQIVGGPRWADQDRYNIVAR